METNFIRSIAMTLDYFAAFMLILILVSCILEKKKIILLKIYICMASSCVAALLLEAVSYSVALFDFRFINSVRTALCMLAIIGGYILAFFYACYVVNLVGTNRRICKYLIRFLRVAGIAASVLLSFGIHFGLFFTIKKGQFITERFFVAIFVYDILACAVGIFLIIKSGKRLNRKDVIALMSLPAFVFLYGLLQYLSFGLMFGLFLMCAIALLIIYLMIQMDRNRLNIEQEKQLVDMNIALMISQIQPHFLYNSLSSIRRMIKKDPSVAETAIENFSMYLRQNLESMNQTELISFSTELKHVEEYLYLEKLRFDDRLRVEYNILYSEFVLPVLTLQPIVENAVKHGVLKKESGGLVKISTIRNGNVVVITVADDGIGFVPESDEIKNRRHIGFENVKKRIEMQCKGTINVESQPGKGTIVTLTIPLI